MLKVLLLVAEFNPGLVRRLLTVFLKRVDGGVASGEVYLFTLHPNVET